MVTNTHPKKNIIRNNTPPKSSNQKKKKENESKMAGKKVTEINVQKHGKSLLKLILEPPPPNLFLVPYDVPDDTTRTNQSKSKTQNTRVSAPKIRISKKNSQHD